MSPPKTAPDSATDTRTALIMAAMDLFLEHGWTGFSYAGLAERIGIRKASIHYHFPSKEDLGLAIIDSWQQMWNSEHDRGEREITTVPERMQAMITFFMEAVCGHEHICPAGALDADFANFSPKMREATQRWANERLSRYAQWLEEGRQQGSLAFSGNAEDQAIALMAGYQGAMQIERTLGNRAIERFTAHMLQSMQP